MMSMRGWCIMPYRAKRRCTHPGCTATYDGQGAYCPAHKAAHEKQYRSNVQDKDRQAFESSARWRKIRHLYLSRYPLCHDCEAQGTIRVAEEVHHTHGWQRNADDDLMGLCTSCHSKRTARGE